jgi:hypothetical protein
MGSQTAYNKCQKAQVAGKTLNVSDTNRNKINKILYSALSPTKIIDK